MNQAIRNRARVQGGVLTGGFTLALTALFVALSVALVLLGAQAYRTMLAATRAAAAQRTAVGYVLNRIFTYDSAGAIHSQRMEIDAHPCDVLMLDEDVDGQTYQTRLFCADGALREQFCAAETPLSQAQDGMEIAALAAFELQQDGNTLKLTFTYRDGTQDIVTAALHAAQEERFP